MTHVRGPVAPDALQLRIAAPADAPAIAEVHVEGWRWGYRGLMPEALLEGIARGRLERWNRTLDDPSTRVWVAERGGAVVGFLSGGAARLDSGTRSDRRAVGYAEVHALYQREAAAGTGVGRALLGEALAHFRSCGAPGVLLWVLTSNARARRFYELAGLRDDGGNKVETLSQVALPHTRYALAFA